MSHFKPEQPLTPLCYAAPNQQRRLCSSAWGVSDHWWWCQKKSRTSIVRETVKKTLEGPALVHPRPFASTSMGLDIPLLYLDTSLNWKSVGALWESYALISRSHFWRQVAAAWTTVQIRTHHVSPKQHPRETSMKVAKKNYCSHLKLKNVFFLLKPKLKFSINMTTTIIKMCWDSCTGARFHTSP